MQGSHPRNEFTPNGPLANAHRLFSHCKYASVREEVLAVHYCNACASEAWHLSIWPKAEPGKKIAIPFRCRSWRHEGECRKWKGSQDFARCRFALLEHDHWVHIVLTYFQRGEALTMATFRQGVQKWSKLRKRLTREYGSILYIQTWEVHRSGWPHVHLALSNPSIHSCSYDEPQRNFKRLIKKHAVESGFGKKGWCQGIYDKEGMVGYLGKLSRELTGTGKEYQIPINAPKNFRRLRASVRLLPPCFTNPEMTGELLKMPIPESVESTLVNTGISGRSEKVYSIEDRETYREKVVDGRWVTEGLE